MKKTTNNPLNPTKHKGFNQANTTSAYYVYFLTVVEDEDFLNFAKQRIADGSYQISFMLRANEKLDDEIKDKILYGVKLLKNNFSDVEFKISFASTSRYYTCEEFKKLLEVKQNIKDHYKEDYELLFVDGYMEFTEKEILTANSRIKEVVNTIKKEKLSPLEAVLYVHTLLTQREYFKEEHENKNRSIYSVLNQKNIICTGFANIFAAIFLELNDPRIKVKEAVLNMDRGAWSHAVNNVYINDEKYGIEGYYYLDACANAENKNSTGLDYFMIPLTDIRYSYVNVGDKQFMFETMEGNLGNNTMPFNADAEYWGWDYVTSKKSGIKEIRNNNREVVLKSTIEFLNTDFANKFKAQFEDEFGDTTTEQEKLYAKIITNVVRGTIPINIYELEKAYAVIAKKFIKTYDLTPEEYAKIIIQQAIDNVPNAYWNSECCKNAFAEEYERQKVLQV